MKRSEAPLSRGWVPSRQQFVVHAGPNSWQKQEAFIVVDQWQRRRWAFIQRHMDRLPSSTGNCMWCHRTHSCPQVSTRQVIGSQNVEILAKIVQRCCYYVLRCKTLSVNSPKENKCSSKWSAIWSSRVICALNIWEAAIFFAMTESQWIPKERKRQEQHN